MPAALQLVVRDARSPLSADEAEAVLALAAEAARADGSDPLSEQFRLSVQSRSGEVTHVLGYAAPTPRSSRLAPRSGTSRGPRGLGLVGYAQSRAGSGDEPASAELVVAPGARRQGVGSALVAALPPDARVWSHALGGAADVAHSFALAAGMVPVRSLHVMGRSLVDGPTWGTAKVSERYSVRTFEPGRDEDAWVAVNAAAFASHPEQGALRRADLDQRMAQPWWDPEGLILVVERDSPDTIAAFHWTKVDPPHGSVGEVYVVGVSPDRQGEGLGKAVTILGLDHLRGRGLREVVLYVDEENVAAVHTYASLGFTDVQLHRQYARP